MDALASYFYEKKHKVMFLTPKFFMSSPTPLPLVTQRGKA